MSVTHDEAADQELEDRGRGHRWVGFFCPDSACGKAWAVRTNGWGEIDDPADERCPSCSTQGERA